MSRPPIIRNEGEQRAYNSGYRRGYSRAKAGTFYPARYDPILHEFTLQCSKCSSRGDPSFWPLTLEFWHPRSLRKCRKCHLRDDAEAKRVRRAKETPEEHAARLAYAREWRARNPGYGPITNKAWRAAHQERYRTMNHERYLRYKAEGRV